MLDRMRPSRHRRGYDSVWVRFRTDYLRVHPYCQAIGCHAVATELHHIKRVIDRPDLRLVPSNVVALCKSCHSAITAREDGFGRK